MKEYHDNFTHEYETALNTLFYMQTLTLECKSVQTLIMLHFVSLRSALQSFLSK